MLIAHEPGDNELKSAKRQSKDCICSYYNQTMKFTKPSMLVHIHVDRNCDFLFRIAFLSLLCAIIMITSAITTHNNNTSSPNEAITTGTPSIASSCSILELTVEGEIHYKNDVL